MAKNNKKKLRTVVKQFLSPLRPSSGNFYFGPTLEAYSTQRRREALNHAPVASRHSRDIPMPDDEEAERINRDRLEQAKIAQAAEALDLTLQSQHRLLVATIITALAAILVAIISSTVALIVAFHSKPPLVNVNPTITTRK